MSESAHKAQWMIQYGAEDERPDRTVMASEEACPTLRFEGGPRDGDELPFPEGRRLPKDIYSAPSAAEAEAFLRHPDTRAPCYTLCTADAIENTAVYGWTGTGGSR
jgi:hypothetical protein